MLGPGRSYLELSDGAHWSVTHEDMQKEDHAADNTCNTCGKYRVHVGVTYLHVCLQMLCVRVSVLYNIYIYVYK